MTRRHLPHGFSSPESAMQAVERYHYQTDSSSSGDIVLPTGSNDESNYPTSPLSSIPPTLEYKLDPTTQLINVKLLVPGKGKPSSNTSIITQSGKITWVGATSSVPDPFRKIPTTNVPYLLPGLWDCHTHLLGAKSLNFAQIINTHPALAGVRLAPNLYDILMSGFTSVRDLGSFAIEVSQAVSEGSIPGPNIYSAGAAISQTAGHGDVFDLPLGFVLSRFGVRDSTANAGDVGCIPLCVADGVDEVRRAVRIQIRRGAKVIKVFASGGVLSIADDPLRQQFSGEELRTIVEEAERAGRVVAAHVHGKVGIIAALKAGVKTVEHGTYMDEECIKLIKEKDAIYIPTRTIVKVGVDHPELMSPESYKKMVETARHHLDAYKLAVKHGVKIALGTDLGISSPTSHPLALGKSGGELVYAVKEAGMSELQAIEAATAMGPLTLGHLGMAPKSGQIEVGFDADMIGLQDNPLECIELFKNPDNVKWVWKGGQLFKKPEPSMKNWPIR